MLSYLKRFYSNQQFYPTFWGLFINPFYIARKGLLREILSLSEHISGRILDIGCGNKPYEKLFVCGEYVGLEIDTPENRKNKKADIFYDGKYIPVDSESFDAVVAFQVFEHVFNPDEFLKETGRVLKQGGILLMTVPFVWDEHEQPFDFARYSSFGLKAILVQNGFEIIEMRKSTRDIRVVFQMINAYLYKITVSKKPFLNIFLCVILLSPFTMVGEILAKILPRNPDLYLDNVVLARKET